MARPSSELIMRENQNRDPSSVTSLKLSLRALSDVSCLSAFKNLERLDLSCNKISTLEGLRSCTNLKWLSVAQNKLESLKGIEGLLKLTVLNAGQNRLQSMDEVRSLTSLGALILNDNNISVICKLERLKYLNTLVLSRNPIHDIGESLSKVKSITKLSLSNCKIQTIGPSLIFCVDLKELRLAGNEIVSLPAEFARNIKLQNLDLGKNLITNWSDLKVFSALHNLKNLNLQGNPVVESNKFGKKVKKLVPNLQILNSKPTERMKRSEKVPEKDHPGHTSDDQSPQNPIDIEGEDKGKRKKSRKDDDTISGKDGCAGKNDVEVLREIKRKPKLIENLFDKVVSSLTEDDNSPFNAADIKPKKKVKGEKPNEVEEKKSEVFDDGKTSFVDLILSGSTFKDTDEQQRDLEPVSEVAPLRDCLGLS